MTWTMSTRPRRVAIKSLGIINFSVLAGVSAECDRTGKSGRTDATHGRERSNYRPPATYGRDCNADFRCRLSAGTADRLIRPIAWLSPSPRLWTDPPGPRAST